MSSLLHLMGNQFRVRHHQTGNQATKFEGHLAQPHLITCMPRMYQFGRLPLSDLHLLSKHTRTPRVGSKAYIKITSQLSKCAHRFCICLKSPTTYLDMSLLNENLGSATEASNPSYGKRVFEDHSLVPFPYRIFSLASMRPWSYAICMGWNIELTAS